MGGAGGGRGGPGGGITGQVHPLVLPVVVQHVMPPLLLVVSQHPPRVLVSISCAGRYSNEFGRYARGTKYSCRLGRQIMLFREVLAAPCSESFFSTE